MIGIINCHKTASSYAHSVWLNRVCLRSSALLIMLGSLGMGCTARSPQTLGTQAPENILAHAAEARIYDNTHLINGGQPPLLATLSSHSHPEMFHLLKTIHFRPSPSLACIAQYGLRVVEQDGSRNDFVIVCGLLGGGRLSSGEVLYGPLPTTFYKWLKTLKPTLIVTKKGSHKNAHL